MSAAPGHPNLDVVRYLGKSAKVRTYYQLTQIAPEGNLVIYNPDIVNVERALKERVFYVIIDGKFSPPPTPKAGVFDRRLSQFASLLKRQSPPTTRISADEFVGYYTGRRRELYEKAAESLLTRGIRPRDAHIKAFVKTEKVKSGSAPRIIQPRDPRYNVEVGRFLRPVEGRVYKGIAKVWRSHRTVMKGMNATQIAHELRTMWDEFSDPAGVGLDASRFDQHCSEQALKWEHARYTPFFRNHMERAVLKRLLKWQLRNKGKSFCLDGKVKYLTSGCRMSGDINTSLGNCVLMCAMVWEYCRTRNVRAKLANNGDDCVVIMERCDVARFETRLMEWFTEMGFTMKMEKPVYDFEMIEFCQAHPLYDGTSYVMVRNTAAFHKDSVSLFPLNTEGATKKWLQAVGDGGMSLAAGVPIWEEFYYWYQRSGGNLKAARGNRAHKFGIMAHQAMESGMLHLSRGMHRQRGVTEEARYSYWVAFGVIPDYQIAVENVIRDRQAMTYTIRNPDEPIEALWRL